MYRFILQSIKCPIAGIADQYQPSKPKSRVTKIRAIAKNHTMPQNNNFCSHVRLFKNFHSQISIQVPSDIRLRMLFPASKKFACCVLRINFQGTENAGQRKDLSEEIYLWITPIRSSSSKPILRTCTTASHSFLPSYSNI